MDIAVWKDEVEHDDDSSLWFRHKKFISTVLSFRSVMGSSTTSFVVPETTMESIFPDTDERKVVRQDTWFIRSFSASILDIVGEINGSFVLSS